MCLNLILMAYQFGNTETSWTGWKASLLADWARFQADPYWLYKHYQTAPIPT